MNFRRNLSLMVAALSAATAVSQEVVRSSSSLYLPAYRKPDVSIPFSVTGEGKRFNPIWGVDLAWINEQNIMKGVNHMGSENVGIGRTSFRVFTPLVNDESLANDQISGLRQRSNLFDKIRSNLPLVLNCDNGYRPNGSSDPFINTYYTASNKRVNVDHWAKCIEAHVAWMKTNTQHPIVGVSPFNEPDNAWEKNLAGEIQGNQSDEANVARTLRNYDSMQGIALCGGNTLNDDNAISWYNTGADVYDWGNTHQLAGSMDNYVKFYDRLQSDGKVGYNDEMHNVVEAMAGLEHGMSVGIWWGFDSRARGEFCDISRHGERIAYGEHRNNWTAGSVYRHDDGRVKAFIGSSERQAKNTTYQFVSKDRYVYYDGYGPVREFQSAINGSTGYMNGQTNAERVIDVTWGEDVAPSEINGTYRIINKVSGKNGNSVGYTRVGGNISQWPITSANAKIAWTVKPATKRTGGDLSFYDVESVADAKVRPNVLNFSLSEASLIAYSQDLPSTNEQWYLEYAGNGYYYIRIRESALYLASKGTSETAAIIQTPKLTGSDHDRMLFRFVPVDVKYDMVAPAKPADLKADNQTASVRLSWIANQENDLQAYMVLRAPQGTNDWNTIARGLTTTYFVDNSCQPNTSYIYKVKAIDLSQNISEASDVVEAAPQSEPSLIARWQFEDNLYDDTDNMFDVATYSAPNYDANHQTGDKSIRLANQFVQLPYEIAASEELTIAMWVKWNTSTTQWQRLFDFGSDTEHYMFLTPYNSYTNCMRFAIKDGGDEQTLDCPYKLASSTWKHVAVTLGRDKVTIYLDGEPVASSEAITIRPKDFRPVLNFLGRSQFVSDPYLQANLDDVQIYNYALSGDEVKQAMNGPVTGIEEVPAANQTSSAVYTLDGKRQNKPVKGLNIIDGRKVILQ